MTDNIRIANSAKRKTRLNITLVHYFSPPFTFEFAGGAERASLEAASALASRGHDVRFFKRGSPGGCRQAGPRFEICDVDCSKMFGSISPGFSYYSSVAARLSLTSSHDDVLISSTNHYPFIFSRSRLNVLWLVGPAMDRWIRWPNQIEMITHLTAMRKCDVVIVVSSVMRKWFMASKLRTYFHGDLVTLPNAVDYKFYRRYREPEDSRMLFVGALVPGKGLAYLLEAIPCIISSWPRARFTIVGGVKIWGTGWADYAVDLRSKVEDLSSRYPGKIEFLLDISKTALLEQYNRAAVMVVPSVWDEPGALSVLEAMSCGVPIIGTNAGSIPEYVDHNQSGLIVPLRDSEAICQAAVSILSDKGRAERLSWRARATIEEKYTWRAHAERLTRLFLEYLDKS